MSNVAAAQAREPMLSHEVPEAPGLTLHADYLEFGGNEYLITVDGFSGWTELASTASRRPRELMRVLRLYMARHGVPRRFHADQGSTFESAEFKEFCAKWGIQFTDNSPKHSQGNAIAEAHVKKVKHILSTVETDDELARALLALMQTPVTIGGPSPAQLHYGRNLRNNLHPRVEKNEGSWEGHVAWKHSKAEKEKRFYDRGTKALTELQPGAAVLIWHRERWQRGTVMRKMGRPRSYEVRVTETGQLLQRNRVQLREIDPEMSNPSKKLTRPASFFQQRLEVPILTGPTTRWQPETEEEEEEPPGPTPASEPDQEENETEEEDEPESPASPSDSEYEGADEDDDQSTPGSPPTTPTTITRAGRAVRPPNRYSPS
jgi:hypothetical protein